MHADIVKIGNSKGLRIPAYILKECKIESEVELKVHEGKIIISPVKSSRLGWDKKFKQMHINKDDMLLVDEKVDIELEDWKW